MAAVPLDIINKVKSHIPKDKNYKSPTSDLIKREFDENNNVQLPGGGNCRS